ncbi:hypothetical protein [Amycolatopsis sp. NPDC006125]|uniref:hypothetical protein n=1 Tax=Amycolatopsis sp. NPDC006125 TaxID=3156730 RepID=UPI0033A68F7E
MSGNVPDAPAPDHVTRHRTVAVDRNRSPGAEAEDRWKVYPQSGDAASGTPSAGNGVPGPAHVTVAPSPIDHDTEVGVAVAVTATPGTDAVADLGCHTARSTHNHVGKRTNCVPAGLDPITGLGNRNCERACSASSSGDGNATAPGASPSGIHTGDRNNASRPPGPEHW